MALRQGKRPQQGQGCLMSIAPALRNLAFLTLHELIAAVPES